MFDFYIGIDPSFTSTGLVCLDKNGDVLKELNIKTKPEKSIEERIIIILEGFKEFISEYDYKKISVGIEGPSFMSKGNASVDMGGLNYNFRIFLFKNQIKYTVIPPKSLVKFVVGRGNASKSLMLKYVFKKWNYDTEIDDLADAYGLARYVMEN